MHCLFSRPQIEETPLGTPNHGHTSMPCVVVKFLSCPRIAQEIAHAFGIDIDKGIIRRVLAKHYRPAAGTDGPSWLSFSGHVKDSLWSVDLFRCESIRSHWVMVVMDVFTRRIIGFGVERADLCGVSICRMFNRIIVGKSLPRHLSSDDDHYFVSIVGSPTCAYSKTKRSSRSRTYPCPIHSWNG
jgi:hypothetical protein